MKKKKIQTVLNKSTFICLPVTNTGKLQKTGPSSAWNLLCLGCTVSNRNQRKVDITVCTMINRIQSVNPNRLVKLRRYLSAQTFAIITILCKFISNLG